MRHRLLACTLALAGLACARDLTVLQRVREVKEVPPSCTALGEISEQGGAMSDPEMLRMQLLAQADKLGATHVRAEASTYALVSPAGYRGNRIQGIAYRCPPAPDGAAK
jgi:hypothetical protein